VHFQKLNKVQNGMEWSGMAWNGMEWDRMGWDGVGEKEDE
jgi:hypothetical protein